MRFYDLNKIKLVLLILEAGKTPSPCEIKEARQAVDRETAILTRRVDQQDINLNKHHYEDAP